MIITMVEGGTLKSKSFEQIRDAVLNALQAQERFDRKDNNVWCWISNMYSDKVVYSCGSTYYQRDYKISKGEVTFGEPVEVESTWTVAESSTERLPVTDCIQMEESAYDKSTGVATITVIKPGFNTSKLRYYPAQTLKRDYKIFEGAKMFTNHQTEKEQKERPEGSVNDWVGNITKVWAEKDGTIKATAQIVDPPFKAKLDTLADTNLLKEMGVSIRAVGEASSKKIEGVETNYVESLVKARSVDFVTYAGAGGRVEAIESEVNDEDIDLLTEAKLRERRPDLVLLVESKKEKDTMKTIEQQLQEAQALAESEKARADKAEKELAESKTAAQKASAKETLTKLLNEAKLPKIASDRLEKQFAEATTVDGMKEAVDAEVAYIKSLNGGKGVKNLGSADAGTTEVEEAAAGTEKKVDLKESFKALLGDDKKAEIASNVR